MRITQEQINAARDARAALQRKHDTLQRIVDAVSQTIGELKEQSVRLQSVRGRTAIETEELHLLSAQYQEAADICSKLWGYQVGRLEQVRAELRSIGDATKPIAAVSNDE